MQLCWDAQIDEGLKIDANSLREKRYPFVQLND